MVTILFSKFITYIVSFDTFLSRLLLCVADSYNTTTKYRLSQRFLSIFFYFFSFCFLSTNYTYFISTYTQLIHSLSLICVYNLPCGLKTTALRNYLHSRWYSLYKNKPAHFGRLIFTIVRLLMILVHILYYFLT